MGMAGSYLETIPTQWAYRDVYFLPKAIHGPHREGSSIWPTAYWARSPLAYGSGWSLGIVLERWGFKLRIARGALWASVSLRRTTMTAMKKMGPVNDNRSKIYRPLTNTRSQELYATSSIRLSHTGRFKDRTQRHGMAYPKNRRPLQNLSGYEKCLDAAPYLDITASSKYRVPSLISRRHPVLIQPKEFPYHRQVPWSYITILVPLNLSNCFSLLNLPVTWPSFRSPRL